MIVNANALEITQVEGFFFVKHNRMCVFSSMYRLLRGPPIVADVLLGKKAFY